MLKVLVLVAVVAAIAWWIVARGDHAGDDRRGTSAQPGTRVPELAAPASANQIVPTPPPAPAPVHDTVGPRPELPAPRPETSGGSAQSVADRFAREARDDRWARPLESDLGKRAAKMAFVQASGIECRASMCRLTLTGAPAAVGEATDSLASLQQRVLLSGNGSAGVTAYIMYAPQPGAPEPE